MERSKFVGQNLIEDDVVKLFLIFCKHISWKFSYILI